MKFHAIFGSSNGLLFRLGFIVASAWLVCSSEYHIVETPSGSLRGVVKESVLQPDIQFVNFLGIPYAAPPVGEYRFTKSVPAEPWQGVLDATTNANDCLQINIADISNPIGDGDCLYLNVFMPLVIHRTRFRYSRTLFARNSMFLTSKNDLVSLKPVIVYIHGGGFAKNAGTSEKISPDFLLVEGDDVVLVAMNYRLHIFGFLNLDIPECSGNMALKDQVLALQWVSKNIEGFGGDPNNVTLMGQSAGAHSTYLHMLSPMSRGLFHKAIIQSPVMPKVVSKDPEVYSIKFAAHLGYEGNWKDRLRILEFISSFDGKKLTEAFATFSEILDETDFRYWYAAQPFKPAIDWRAKEAFLPRSLLILGSEAPALPILMGSTSLDGAIAFAGNEVQEVISYLDEHLKAYLDTRYTQDEDVKLDVIAQVKEFYFGGKTMDENALGEAINLYTDVLFYHFETYNSFLQASFRSNKIYTYHFCFDGSMDFYKKRYLGLNHYQKVRGAVHSQDMLYLFYSQKNYPDLELTEDDRGVVRNMSKWWTNFAKTGNPNDEYDGIEWKPISPEKRWHLQIDADSRFIEGRPNERRRQFWDKLSRDAFSKQSISRFLLVRRWLNL